MKKIIWAIITLGVILFVNWGLAAIFNNNFFDWSFFTGLAVTIVIAFFNSTGGIISDYADGKIQSPTSDLLQATAIPRKIEKQQRSFHPTISSYAALSYTVIAGILSLVYYKDFFIN